MMRQPVVSLKSLLELTASTMKHAEPSPAKVGRELYDEVVFKNCCPI